ncbi:hypothetical protein BGZ74_006635 [Mortierella antarctica]|nr:hypothetical protein BGZ74_006635 [Mortierella antarctica]
MQTKKGEGGKNEGKSFCAEGQLRSEGEPYFSRQRCLDKKQEKENDLGRQSKTRSEGTKGGKPTSTSSIATSSTSSISITVNSSTTDATTSQTSGYISSPKVALLQTRS